MRPSLAPPLVSPMAKALVRSEVGVLCSWVWKQSIQTHSRVVLLATLLSTKKGQHKSVKRRQGRRKTLWSSDMTISMLLKSLIRFDHTE